MKPTWIVAPFAFIFSLLIAFSGCKKEDEIKDYRDEYVGTYEISLTCYISSREGEPYDTSDVHLIQVEKDTADETGILVGFFKAQLAQDGTFKSKIGTPTEQGTINGKFIPFQTIEYSTYKGNLVTYNTCSADGKKYVTEDEVYEEGK